LPGITLTLPFFLHDSFAGFVDTTIYVYCTEIFPTNLRAKGMGFSIAVFMLATIPYLESFTLGVAKIGWRYYLVFIIMAVVFVPAIWYCCPETKGLSLEEINGLFGDEVVVQLTHTSGTVLEQTPTNVSAEVVEGEKGYGGKDSKV
jgi:MFS family permease